MSSTTNCLSIDVEGFIESNLESFHIPARCLGKTRESYEIEYNTNTMLELLAEFKVNATFFFVGRIACDVPSLVKQVAQAGHEIGCHSYEHRRIFRLRPMDFKEQVYSAKCRLESLCGRKVYGFRAPEFSITEDSLWALDALSEIGFTYDSSIFPIRLHDVCGLRSAQHVIYKLPNGLTEWPLPTFEVFGMRFPFGGGGYFRLYPLCLTEHLIRSTNQSGQPCMFYIHPYEVGPIRPQIPGISLYRRFRHYFNCGTGAKRLKSLLRTIAFCPAIEILRKRGFVADA